MGMGTSAQRMLAGFGEYVRGQRIRLSGTPGNTTLDVLCRAEDSDPDEGGERLTPQAGVCAATPCCGINRRETTLWRRGLRRRSALAVPWRIEFADQAHFERPRIAVPPSPQFNDPPFEHGQ